MASSLNVHSEEESRCWCPESLPYVAKPRRNTAAISPPVRFGTVPLNPPPPDCADRRLHDAGRMTRKLIGCPYALLSIGAITPSIEQYAGALPAGTHLGAASVTPAT